jgi:broad specificity phosphatase PhoE
MVAVMIIRHSETKENVAMAKAVLAVERGEVNADEAHDLMRSVYKSDDDIDSPLTKKGEEMASQLAAFYAPLLKDLADRGKVHFFCSPMQRNMQTADELVNALGIRATVREDLKETGGLLTNTEMATIRQMEKLALKGDSAAAKAMLKQQSKKGWTKLGMTGDQIQSRFKWTDLEPGFPQTTPWHTTGLETDRRAVERAQRVLGWLQEQSDRLPHDDLIIFISHGAAIAKLLTELLGCKFMNAVSYANFDNTSVSGFTLGNSSTANSPPPQMFQPAEQRDIGVRVQYLNRVDHLVAVDGSQRIRGYIRYPFATLTATVSMVDGSTPKPRL